MDRDPENRECTRDPIFLVQRRVPVITGSPDWLVSDGDGGWEINLERYNREEYDRGLGEMVHEVVLCSDKVMRWLADNDYVVETWVTERVLLTRTEAEKWVKVQEYNYPDGWRVYCVPCEGRLATLLDQFPEDRHRDDDQDQAAEAVPTENQTPQLPAPGDSGP